MAQERWDAVDDYFTAELIGADTALDAALQASRDAGLPAINVAPNQGKLLHLLALAVDAGAILEVGTLGGYSTIWMGRALPPGGRITTLEIDPHHAEVARANLERAGLAEVAEVRVGPAAASLAALVEEGAGPYDLVFIDADKPGNPEYFDWALRLTRPGSLIVVDNVVRSGAVADAASTDAAVVGSRRVIERMGAAPEVEATAVQTVGSKGHDGFAIARVVGL